MKKNYIKFWIVFYGLLPNVAIMISGIMNSTSDSYNMYNLSVHSIFAFVCSYILSKSNIILPLKMENRTFPVVTSFLLNSVVFCFCAIESKGFIGSTVWMNFGLLNLGFWLNDYIYIFDGDLKYTVYIPMTYRFFGLIGFFIGHSQTVSKSERVKTSKVITYILICLLLISTSFYKFNVYDKNLVNRSGSEFQSVNLWEHNPVNPKNILPVLKSPSTFTISGVELPVLNGLEYTYPLYSAFANACYYNYFIKQESSEEEKYHYKDYTPEKVLRKTTLNFQNQNDIDRVENSSKSKWIHMLLLNGEVDIFFGQNPSQQQLERAKEEGVELKITPIAKEALVFMVHSNNPIENLTIEQIKKIYSKKINNWQELNGEDIDILAFQKTKNLDSQNMMEEIMGTTILSNPLKEEYKEFRSSEVQQKNAEYQNKENSIGYNFKFFVQMKNKKDNDILNKYSKEEIEKDSEIKYKVLDSKNNLDIKLLKINGVEPTNENILNGKYPLSFDICAVTLEDNENPKVNEFVKWMLGEQGQELVEKVGYIPLKPTK